MTKVRQIGMKVIMKRGNKSQVKLLASVEESLRGHEGDATADNEPSEMVLADIEDEAVPHQLFAKDLEKIKKSYERPAFRYEQVFVTSALSCGKVNSSQGQCNLNRKVS
jgi:hypothetical protein